MKNIHTLATDNATRLADDHSKARTDKSDTFCDFLRAHMEFSISSLRGMVDEGVVQKNVFSKKPSISFILQSGKYLSEWEHNTADPEKHFGKYHQQRVAFDETFDLGKKFKYMALITGGMGLAFWGDVTLVISPHCFVETDLVIVKYNSLIKNKSNNGFYYFDGDAVNTTTLQSELATLNNLEQLAVLKLFDHITDCNPDDFRNLLLQPIAGGPHQDYLEVITWKDLIMDECLQAIRMKESVYAQIDILIGELRRNDQNGIHDASLHNLEEFHKLLVEYEDKGIDLETI